MCDCLSDSHPPGGCEVLSQLDRWQAVGAGGGGNSSAGLPTQLGSPGRGAAIMCDASSIQHGREGLGGQKEEPIRWMKQAEVYN